MDVSQYLEIFIDESNEHLQNLSDGIMILEKEPDNSDTINEIFRAAHSLKGMAGTMGYKRMQNLTHDMENVFSEVRNGNIKVDSRMVDVLFQCLDALEQYVNNIQETSDEGTDDNEPIIKALNSFIVNNEDKGVLPEEAKKEEAPAEEKKEESTDVAGTYARYNNMVFADFEKNAVNEAIEKKMNVFIIKVSVDENCILKAARAFLVFKNLEGHCDIIKSEPSAQDIEDEKFELDFSIVVVTEESYESIVGIIKNVSEIKDAAGEAITTPFADEDDKEEKQDTPKQEEKKDESETKPSASVTAKKQAPAANNNKAGKTVSHTVRVDIEKLDVLMNLVSELIIAKNGLVSASVSEDGTTSVNQKFGEQIEYLERVTTNLHESVMKVRMMPIESVFAKYPRMIRDLNKKLGKKMELYMSGEETELDRTVIDEIGDPIMHLLRNSADHGLESAEIRAERGKPEVGSIWLDAYQEGNNVVIEVRDDGELIDVYKACQKNPDKKLISLLKQHNYEDVIDMPKLLSVLSYVKLFEGAFNVTSICANESVSYDGKPCREILFSMQNIFPVPKRVSCHYEDFHLVVDTDQTTLCVRLYTGELKYFLSDYKNYWYLPEEDLAIPSSLAASIPKERRKKATAGTCYKKKNAIFVPQYQEIQKPAFRLMFKDKKSYFELSEDFVASSEMQKEYCMHVLQFIWKKKL